MSTGLSILEKNLAALRVSSPRLAELLRATMPRTDVVFTETEEGVFAGAVGGVGGAGGRALCSRRRPLEEARKLAGTIDIAEAAGVVVLGFGAGHHVRAMLERMARTGVLIVFEPDLPLLRAVLERIDHSGWLVSPSIAFLTDPEDTGAISQATTGCEGLLAMGVKFLEHPADKARIGALSTTFQTNFTAVYSAVRTQIVTTLVNSDTTVHNLLMNADRYTTSPGVADLTGAAAGRPAIVVSAGPSLRRNIDLLAGPGVRDRFVIIAVQTVLKQLLARGIRPHFVTALDHHEISRRFYEGLTSADVGATTLVAMPWANPAILECFPGSIRIPADWTPDQDRGAERGPGSLDDVLGPALAFERGKLLPGATVAHMACYLARHMGCDPVILIGQDLGFTDGQYYAAGAAIHDVWSGELNAFRTLEMLEWERIVRGRSHLHRATDVLGRPVYTDEQMRTYRVQFERDFAADRGRGLRIIDATEGGVAKQGAEPMPLSAALEMFRPAEPLRLPEPAPMLDVPARLERLAERIRAVRQEVWRVQSLSERGRMMLEEMFDAQGRGEHRRVNTLIGQVQEIGTQATALQPAFGLVRRINQTGVFNRAKADRQIAVESGLPPLERQARQIRRDITNLSWTADAAARMGRMLEGTLACLAGGPRQTRDMEEVGGRGRVGRAEEQPEGHGPRTPAAVAALIPLDPDRSGLSTPRNLSLPVHAGLNALELALRRLARCASIKTAVILCADPERARRLAGEPPAGLTVAFERTDGDPMGPRIAALGSARIFAPACWRGGLGGLTVYDEILAPGPMLRVMEERGLDAAVLIGADWALVDPTMIDDVVARFRQRPSGPGAHRLTFCQAPPGIGACLVERSLMKELAERSQAAGVFASIGGLLGYVPIAPLADPIAKPVCVAAPARIRDVAFRCIPDSEHRRAVVGRALDSLGEAALTADAERITRMIAEQLPAHPAPAPHELVLELCTGRRAPRTQHGSVEAPERPVMTRAAADRLLRELASLREDATLTLAGAGDPMLHAEALAIIALAKRHGIATVHVRTDLLCEPERVDALLDSGVDVISVDLAAETPTTYRAVMGTDQLDRARFNIQRLLERRAARPAPGGLPTPWIIPRITRCDATYAEIESFYDRWIMLAGAAVIDPLPVSIPGERIEPLPLPAAAAIRLGGERMMVLSDGRVPATDTDLTGDRTVADALRDGLAGAWRRLSARRRGHSHAPPPLHEIKPEMLHGAGSRARVASLGAL